MGFFKKLFKALSNKKYRKNPHLSNLTGGQLVALSVGAINAEQVSYFCDSLETGSDKREIADNLANYYDIYNSETAVATLKWLQTEGHRVCFDAIKQVASGASATIDAGALTEEQVAAAHAYIGNLKSTVNELRSEKCITGIAALGNTSIIAWDMGRLVLISRCCWELGYISETEAWGYIYDACAKCKEVYTDWSGMANGYIIGRAMWGGSNMMLTGIIGIAQDLLSDSDSPWNKMSLR